MTGDLNLEAALYRSHDLAFDRKTGMKRVFELSICRRFSRELPREDQSSPSRNDHGLNAIANRYFETALRVLQFFDVYGRFTFPADVDERHLWANSDNLAFERLPSLDALGLNGRLEHRREVICGIGHGLLSGLLVELIVGQTQL
jgi:hypothetical protein